jgi:predicted dehydrogenase
MKDLVRGKTCSLLALTTWLFAVGCSHEPPGVASLPPPEVSVAAPVEREVVDFDEFTGRMAAIEEVEVRARVRGYLVKVNFTEGAEVKQGDVLFEIDPRPFQAELDAAKGQVAQWEAWLKDEKVEAAKYGYEDFDLGGHKRSALEELCRWRLFKRTGGGLMAELGSHQLDAASIFISALRKDGKKAHPLTIHAVGGRQIFPHDRDSEDHVYCLFEFPGPGYDPGFPVGYYDPVRLVGGDKGVPSFNEDPEKRIVVMYSSINGNGFGGYGEVVMGTRGTLIIEREKEAMLIPASDSSTRIGVKEGAGGPTLDTQASGQMAIAKASEPANVSRGYREELEHWAYCIRNPSPENQPRCRPDIALGDAAIALTANIAIDNARKGLGGFLHFKEEWFDVDSDEIPSPVDAKTGKPLLNFEEEKKNLLG